MPETFMDRFAVRDICDDNLGSYEPQTNLLHARKSWFTVRIGTCTNIDREEFY